VWLPKPCMWRKLFGMPRSLMTIVDLMQRFRKQRPEVPVVVGAAHTGSRITLDGVVEVRKPQRIAEEEYRRVVSHDVPVALLSIELQREAADIALGVRGAALARDSREAGRTRGLLAGSWRRSLPWCSG